MSSVTKPPLLDETGKNMLLALEAVVDAINEMSGGVLQTWAQIQSAVRHGRIGHYVQQGSQLEVESSILVTAAAVGEGLSVSVNKDTFLSMVSTTPGLYEYVYTGAAWHHGTEAVSLTNIGITLTGTPHDGDEIVVTITGSEADYDVLGIDEDFPINTGTPHVLSIKRNRILSSINFDPPMYLYAVTAAAWPNGLPAGTYNVTLNHAASSGGTVQDGTYQFTTTQTIPVGGGIRHSSIGAYRSDGNYTKAQILAGTFTTYAADTITTLETGLVTTEGNEGTNLGTTTARDPQYKSGDYIFFADCQARGCNRYGWSYIRQLLNSDDAVLQWKPASIWSRNISAQPEGFLHSIDPNLRKVLCKVRKRHALPINFGYGYEDLEDYVTLDSILDVFGQSNNSIYEGPVDDAGTVIRKEAYSYWKARNTNADRIKRDSGGNAAAWWLDSANPSNGSSVFSVYSSGARNGNFASNAYGVVPSLHIG